MKGELHPARREGGGAYVRLAPAESWRGTVLARRRRPLGEVLFPHDMFFSLLRPSTGAPKPYVRTRFVFAYLYVPGIIHVCVLCVFFSSLFLFLLFVVVAPTPVVYQLVVYCSTLV